MTDRSDTTSSGAASSSTASTESPVAKAERVASGDEAGTIAAGMARIAATFEAALDGLDETVDDPSAGADPRAAAQFAEAAAPAAEAGSQLAEEEIGQGETDLLNLDSLGSTLSEAELFPEDSLTGTGDDVPQNLPDTIPNQQASFTPGPGPEILPGIGEEGPIDPTALRYRVPEYEPRTFGSDDDGGDGGNGDDDPLLTVEGQSLAVQEGSTGTGNVAAIGTQISPVPMAIEYIDAFDDGYEFQMVSVVRDAASGLLSGVSIPGATLTGITYVGNNDGNLGAVTPSFDGIENQLTFSAVYGSTEIWRVVFDMDDGAYEFMQLAPYSHLGTPGDILEESFQFEVSAAGQIASAAFTLSIQDDAPETATDNFFLSSVPFGSDGNESMAGNVLQGLLGPADLPSFQWRPVDPGPIHTAFFPQGPGGSNAIQSHPADDLGADGGHLYSVTYNGITYQRIWDGSQLSETEWLVDGGVEAYSGIANFLFSTSESSSLTLNLFFSPVPDEDIEEGDFRMTLDPFDVVNDDELSNPFQGSFSYQVIDNDGDISAAQVVDFAIFFQPGLPDQLLPPTYDNMPEYGVALP